MSRAIIYFTRELPGLSEELSQAGLQVYEALAISELFYLAEQHPCAHIVVDHTVERDAAHEVARHHISIRLARESTAVDVIWELSQLDGDATVQ